MSIRNIFTLVVLLASLLPASPVRAHELYQWANRRQEEKAKTRWTLSEWLETRDRMRLMDLWLAMNSPSPFEFFIGGANRLDEGWSVQAAAYATIFGLGFERNSETTSGEFLLRVLGNQIQGTNLTLSLGVRSGELRNAYAGAGLTIYLARYFGLDGSYRRHFAAVPNSAGLANESFELDWGAFIDFKFLRVFGSLGTSVPDGATGSARTTLGARLYF
jgi:hypothetical protein